jgi:protein SCO1
MMPTESSSARRFFSALPLLLLLFIGVGVGVVAWSSSNPPEPELPDYGAVADFSLTASDGQTVTLESLKRFPWVADFIFTRCQGICPMMTVKMRALTQEIKGSRFVSFSVDPTFDTVSKLADYAQEQEADTTRWHFLTGDSAAIERVAKSFYLNGVEEPTMHSSRFALVDGNGRIRGYYDSADSEAMDRLVREARLLERQGKAGL